MVKRIFLSPKQAASIGTTDVRTLVGFTAVWMFSIRGGVGLLIKPGECLAVVWAMMLGTRFCQNMVGQGVEKVQSLSNLPKPFTLTAVYRDLTGQAKERFDAGGTSIEFGQQYVHLFQAQTAGKTA